MVSPTRVIQPVDLISWSNPDDTPYLLTLKREKVRLEEQAASSLIETLQFKEKTYNIGLITIPSFYQDYQLLILKFGKKHPKLLDPASQLLEHAFAQDGYADGNPKQTAMRPFIFTVVQESKSPVVHKTQRFSENCNYGIHIKI